MYPDSPGRTADRARLRRPTSVAVALALALVGMFTVWFAAPAQADEFNPENSAPAVGVTTSTLAMAPDTGASDNVYTIVSNVTDSDSLMDVNTVTWCVYLVTQTSGTWPGDQSSCSAPDPKTNVKFTWDRATDSFAVDDGTGLDYWALGTGGDAPVSDYTSTNTSMNPSLKFTVSEAARAGDWGVKMVADDGDATANHSDTTGYTMAYWSVISTPRAQQDFGVLTGGFQDKDNVGVDMMANSATNVDYVLGGDFVDGSSNTATVATGVAGSAPGAGQVSFDCSPTGTYDINTDVRVTTAGPSTIAASQYAEGAPENGATNSQSCRLTSGGAIPRAGSPYTATVTVSVIQTP